MSMLDRPIWEALSGRHSAFSTGTARARAYAAEIGPLAALGEDTAEGLADLAALVNERGRLLMFNESAVPVPPGCRAEWRADVLQMIATHIVPQESDHPVVALRNEDAAEMLALAELTKPGPFSTQTHRLGRFWGIRIEGRLVAMAGQRMRLPGHGEVSAICTHPDARGRGLAKQLCARAAAQIIAEGERAFLHVLSDNESAIRVYETIGFVPRRSFIGSMLVPDV